jgi:hypothetical protein
MRKAILFSLFILCVFSAWGQTKTTQVSFSGYVNGHYVKATGILEYRFSWAFSPVVKAEFKTLEITRIDYEGVQYDHLKNRSKIRFPYSCAGYPTNTEIKCSMPYIGFNSVNNNLYATSGSVGFDFTTPEFKQKYNSESSAKKSQIQNEWEAKPFVSDVIIVELSSSLINDIINDIKSTLNQEAREKEEEEQRLEEERLAELEKEEEEERQRQEEEEERQRQEEEERLAELEKEKEDTSASSGGGTSKSKKKKEKEKKSDSKNDDYDIEDDENSSSKSNSQDNSEQYRLYADAHYKARQAEANGNISQALYWYKVANGYSYNSETYNKIKSLETQQNINNVAAGAVTFATGFDEAFRDLEDGRIDKLTMSSAYHYAKSTFLESPASKGSKGHLEAYLAFDFYMWIVKHKLGVHLSAFGSFANSEKELEYPRDDAWIFEFTKLELGGTAGINFFGLLDVDYIYRGLKLSGEYSYNVPNTVTGFGLTSIETPFGGSLHFDGGLRAAIYLSRKKSFFVRASAWYINGSEEGMLTTFDPKSTKKTTSTQSQGVRLEIVKRPWSFGIFRNKHIYNNPMSNNLSVNAWGIGLLFGVGN